VVGSGFIYAAIRLPAAAAFTGDASARTSMQDFRLLYLVASAAFALFAARGIFHFYGKILRRKCVLRTPEGRAARLGCVPTVAAFVAVFYGAQFTAPWIKAGAGTHGQWVYSAAIGIMAFFPALYVVVWWYSRRVDISALQTGMLPDDAVRSETRKGEEIKQPEPADIAPLEPGAILLIEIAAFYSAELVYPPRPATVYGFGHAEPVLERPLRGAWLLEDTLYLAGVHRMAEGGKLPPLLAVTATLREGVEHEFVRRVSLSPFPVTLRPGALRIYGLDGEGALVFDVGAKRERVLPDALPGAPVKWSGYLRAGNAVAREAAQVSIVSFRLFSPGQVVIMKPGANILDVAARACPVVPAAPPPATREPGPVFFGKQDE
jgi:hypothetical protein